MKDYFSSQASGYAQFRPRYPVELFEFLLSITAERELAWDCATGNGQTAKELSPHFKHVYASDISQKQLDHATPASNITYAVGSAEHVELNRASVDLITVSQAFHWFEHEKFYEEVKRVSKPNAILALWSYSLLTIDEITDSLILDFYDNTLNGYWDPERIHVDEGYRNIAFPFTMIPSPQFSIKVKWSSEQLAGYLNTWSAVQKFISINHYNPIESLMASINQNWPEDTIREIEFPLSFKAAWVHK